MWGDSIVPELVEYIRIPNKSPAFDPDWAAHGYMEDAVALMVRWCEAHLPAGARLEVVRLEGRTPVIFIDVPARGGASDDDCVLLYGHLDKQPEMAGWRADLGPWKPVLEGDKLYGRGGADDGYAVYASLTALLALAEQDAPHTRCVVLIEACEESGSFDLPFYIDALAERIGRPSLVVCLDSGCGNYDQLWCTTSLRGMAGGTLSVEVLSEGVHSGAASGVVPSSFRIVRALLDRIEDAQTGAIREPSFHAPIPEQRRRQAATAAQVLGSAIYEMFPMLPGMRPVTTELEELVLNRTWRPALAVTGGAGMPLPEDAGNVLRPATILKLSLRLPPTLDSEAANARLKALLETDPPYGARVRFDPKSAGDGWDAPALAGWLEASAGAASRDYFGADCVYMGEGGSIPFMGMLGARFPEAQFLITGVLGPHSNAHGPNEFLHLPTGRKLTACVTRVLADHAARTVG
ncbi:MAG: M20 family metallopeptidase [Ectothiorhodospiraceae bacterium]|nr:M20 family metallopeptidase [Chromatiales bacterium]MCP5153967.1 M20 family metallopeptidase [Ectothiorhodospiraceae bacterium]